MIKYLKLFRVQHYLKNFLIFLPLFFSINLREINMVWKAIFGFILFSILASSIYIFNDLIDVEQDRKHPQKKFRPIPSGEISETKAKLILASLYIIIIVLLFIAKYFNIFTIYELIKSSIVLLVYLIINILYSKGLKNVPIVDIIILATGFLLRVVYGGFIISVNVSSWLYLTVLSVSLYMALGKRRGELKNVTDNSRKVLKYYTYEFLDKFMYIFLGTAIIFYSLWCMIGFTDPQKSTYLIYSVIFVIFIIMKYNLDLEGESLGDPIDVIYNDKLLLLSTFIFAIYLGGVIYA